MKSVTTESRERRTFSSAAYLADLMAEMDRAAISQRIRKARTEAGFRNRQELADVMQVHWRTIEDWENPKHQNVPWDRMEELAQITNVSKMWLLHGEPEAAEDDEQSTRSHLDDIEAKLDRLTAAVEVLAEAVAASRSDPGDGRSGQTGT